MTVAAAGGRGAGSLEYRVLAQAVAWRRRRGHRRPGRRTARRGVGEPRRRAPPGPADLLASAFAACLLKNLARSGALLGFEYNNTQVDVVLRRQDAPPKFVWVDYTLRVTTDEPERRVELVHTNLRKFGTVYNTLAAVCDVHGTVIAPPQPPMPSRARGRRQPSPARPPPTSRWESRDDPGPPSTDALEYRARRHCRSVKPAMPSTTLPDLVRTGQRRALSWALGVNTGLLVVEVIGGGSCSVPWRCSPTAYTWSPTSPDWAAPSARWCGRPSRERPPQLRLRAG